MSVPAATNGRAETEAAYRFFDNDGWQGTKKRRFVTVTNPIIINITAVGSGTAAAAARGPAS